MLYWSFLTFFVKKCLHILIEKNLKNLTKPSKSGHLRIADNFDQPAGVRYSGPLSRFDCIYVKSFQHDKFL